MNINSTKPYFPAEDIENIILDIREMFRTGMLAQSINVKQFEDEFAKYVGTKFAIATNSGTSTLEIILRYFNVKDKEVIVPTNTFIASSNAVIFAGGKPVLADIKADSLCINPKDIENKLTDKTCGIMIVHLAGLICPDLEEIKTICNKNNLFLIEDAAHAHGASVRGVKAGNLSDAGSFSFFPSKVMTTGEGGMITTNNKELAELARSMRHHGIGDARGELVRLGYNWRMSEINAILGKYQLRRLDQFIDKRIHIAEIYNSQFKHCERVHTISVPPDVRHSYYKFPLILNKGIDREFVSIKLKQDYNIGVGSIYWPPCHLQPVYLDLFKFKKGMLPVAEDILNRTIALPIFIEMTDLEIEYVVDSVIKIIKNY